MSEQLGKISPSIPRRLLVAAVIRLDSRKHEAKVEAIDAELRDQLRRAAYEQDDD